MPGLKDTTVKGRPTRTKSEGGHDKGKKTGPPSGRKGSKQITTRTILVRNTATQKPSLKDLTKFGSISTGIKNTTVPRRKASHEGSINEVTGVITTTPIVLPASKSSTLIGLDRPKTALETKPSTAITSAYDALLESRSFSILSVPKGSGNLKEDEQFSKPGKQPELGNDSFAELVLHGDKIKHEAPSTTHRPRERANIAKGGLEVRRPPRMRSENGRSNINVTTRVPVNSRFSEQSINERRKLQEQTYTPDPRLKLCGIKTREPPRQLIENGKKLLQKTQRRVSAVPSFSNQRNLPMPANSPVDEIYRRGVKNLHEDPNEPEILSGKRALGDSLASPATSVTFDLDSSRLPLNLSAIELKAATIKEHIDPLELREEGILDVIRNPHDDINSKTLSRLLGEQRTVPLRKLKDKIWEKVSKSQDLISPEHSITSISTSASSTAPGLVEDENTSEAANLMDFKRKKTKKKAKRKALKKANLSQPNLTLCTAASSDFQMQVCLQRQEELEGQVSQFLSEMRQKIESSRQTCSPETLETLESLVKTQSEIVNMQMDLKKRYLEQRWGNTTVSTGIDADEKSFKEPILNAFNLDYGRLTSYARETDGKIEFYCPTCKVACENETKFRLHLEGTNHVSKAHKELQSSQPWYNCNQCKTQIQGTTQYLSHVVEKKHVASKNSHSSLAVNVLENKKSFHNIHSGMKK